MSDSFHSIIDLSSEPLASRSKSKFQLTSRTQSECPSSCCIRFIWFKERSRLHTLILQSQLPLAILSSYNKIGIKHHTTFWLLSNLGPQTMLLMPISCACVFVNSSHSSVLFFWITLMVPSVLQVANLSPNSPGAKLQAFTEFWWCVNSLYFFQSLTWYSFQMIT